MNKNRKTHAWESDIAAWFKRHEIPEEKTNLFMEFLFKKKVGWDIEIMREMVAMKDVINPMV